MSKLSQFPQPIKLFAYILLSSSVFGVWLLYDLSQRSDFDVSFSVFVTASMLLHLLVGVSVLSMKSWGYTLFKCYLYLLFLAIPVGTYISYKTLKFMDAHKIGELYQ